MKKRAIVLLMTLAVIFSSVFLCAADFAEEYTYKAILPQTPLYSLPDLSCAMEDVTIPQNAAVELTGDSFDASGIIWQPVKYTGIEGYVVKGDLYRSLKNDKYDVVLVKAKATKMGEDIVLYETHSVNLPATIYVHDGERLKIVQDDIDYGSFYMAEVNGKYYFVLKSNVTNGLSYNQTLAVIISACFLAAIIIAVSVVLLVKRKRRI